MTTRDNQTDESQLNKMINAARQWIREHRLPLIMLLLWLLLALAIQRSLQARGITISEILTNAERLMTDYWYSPLIYILIYFLRPLTLIPGTPFTMLGGYLYGPIAGGALALIAGVLSSLLPYVFGRWFANDDPHPHTDKDDDSIWQRTVHLLRGNPFQSTLTTRLLYLPYDTVNFIAGNIHIPFVPYISATLIGNAVPAFAGAGIGASVEGNLSQGNIRLNPVILGVSITLWVASFAASRWYKHHLVNSDSSSQQGASS